MNPQSFREPIDQHQEKVRQASTWLQTGEECPRSEPTWSTTKERIRHEHLPWLKELLLGMRRDRKALLRSSRARISAEKRSLFALLLIPWLHPKVIYLRLEIPVLWVLVHREPILKVLKLIVVLAILYGLGQLVAANWQYIVSAFSELQLYLNALLDNLNSFRR